MLFRINLCRPRPTFSLVTVISDLRKAKAGNVICNVLPLHVRLLGIISKPFLQRHTYEPGVLSQIWLQPDLLSLHSSISKEKGKMSLVHYLLHLLLVVSRSLFFHTVLRRSTLGYLFTESNNLFRAKPHHT